jgi:hypothetical protein
LVGARVGQDERVFVGGQIGRGVFSADPWCQRLTAVVIFVISLERYVVCSIAMRGPSDEERSHLP